MQVVPVDEGHGDPGLPGAAGPACAVQIGVVVVGDRVVDHVGDIVHVDAARGDVGRDEDVLLAGLEGGHRALALLLVEVSVHGGGVEASVVELFDELGCGALGAGEDDGLTAALGLQDARDDLVLVHVVRAVDDVLDVRLSEPLVGVCRADVDRAVHESAREGDDRPGHRRREQHGVPGRRGLREELLDVGEEPEVEHLVGLVEDHHLDVLEAEHPLAGEVEEATGGAHDDLRARLELLDLALVRLATVDRRDLGRAVGRGEREVLGDLDAQLAGRDDDEGLDSGFGVQPERLEQGKPEAERLACPRLGLPDDVLAVQSHGDRLALDGERFDDPLGGESVDHVLIDIEFCESHVLWPVMNASTPACS